MTTTTTSPTTPSTGDHRVGPVLAVAVGFVFLTLTTGLNVLAWWTMRFLLQITAIIEDPVAMASVGFTFCELGLIGLWIAWTAGRVRW